MSVKVKQYDYTTALKLPSVPKVIFADPPYNIGVKYRNDPTKDRLPKLEYEAFLVRTMGILRMQMEAGTTLWWICPEVQADRIGGLLTDLIGPRLYRIVWQETFSQYNRYDLTQDYRFIFCHYLEGTKKTAIKKNFDPIRIPSTRMLMRDSRAAGPKIPGRVWSFRRLQGTAIDRVDWHPTQLPPELLDRIILGWTTPTDLVVDAFAGSGSLGMRCLKHNRQFLGLEKSEAYCERMRQRFRSS